MDKKMLPIACPCCGQALKAKRFECPGCSTVIEGDFFLPLLARLSRDDQDFLTRFVLCGGSLKELQRIYAVSYPTVRNRLDALIERMEAMHNSKPPPESMSTENQPPEKEQQE